MSQCLTAQCIILPKPEKYFCCSRVHFYPAREGTFGTGPENATLQRFLSFFLRASKTQLNPAYKVMFMILNCILDLSLTLRGLSVHEMRPSLFTPRFLKLRVCTSYLVCSLNILRPSSFLTEAFVNWLRKHCTT